MQKAGQKIKTNQSLRLDFIKYLVSKQDVSRNEELEIPLNIDESHVRVSNRLFERHFIEKNPDNKQHDCHICSDRSLKRKTTTFRCKFCLVPLCPDGCFEKYHSKRNYYEISPNPNPNVEKRYK